MCWCERPTGKRRRNAGRRVSSRVIRHRTHGAGDRVFGTMERPDIVRVPRRMALPWLVDDSGELLPEFADDYRLVGSADAGEREAMLDRARAFASAAPID